MEMLKCYRCEYEWWPRKTTKPRMCPKCKSAYWDRPRKEKKDAESSKGPRTV
jgi:predicted Zn-ribbon and HTH transcriptional regulator